MNNKHRVMTPVIYVTVFALIGAFAISQTTLASPDNGREKLPGSWSVEATTPSVGAFPALLTFTADGSVIADESPSPFESSGHGSWASQGQRGAAYTFIALFGGEDGKNTGKLKVAGTLQFDAGTDSWRGPFTIDITDTGGKIVFTDRGTFSLKRIAVEPPG